MSTNYYLVNIQHERIKLELDKLIDSQINKLRAKLLKFNDENELGIQDNILDRMKILTVNLRYDDIFEIEKIHICKTAKSLTWQVDECFNDLDSFVKFYNGNKDKYYIENEYNENLSLNDFIMRITWDNQEIKYETREFF